MRHRVKKQNLNMQNDHQELLVRGLVTELFLHSKIKTTVRKAKITSSIAEKLISFAKKNDKMISIRKMDSYLLKEEASKNLLDKILPSLESKKSGYTRITKAGYRAGDSAEMCYLEIN